MGWLIFIGIIFAIWFIVWLSNRLSNLREMAKKYVELKPKLDNLDKYRQGLEHKESRLVEKETQLENNQLKWEKKVKTDTQAIETLAKEKTQGFPWLAQAYADYVHLQDLKKAKYLELKSHPAFKAAEQVRAVSSQRRTAEKLYRVLKYKLEYYENLFPWLVDFTGEDIDELIKQVIEEKERGKEELTEPDDPVKKWLTRAEYNALSNVERNQRALDRYWLPLRIKGSQRLLPRDS
jgi:hypothetical protein